MNFDVEVFEVGKILKAGWRHATRNNLGKISRKKEGHNVIGLKKR
jgi:hypothetical protein